MWLLFAVSVVAVSVSLFVDPKKTYEAVRIGTRKFTKILPAFLMMLLLVSIILEVIPQSMIVAYLGESNLPLGVLLATLLGSISFMPGFIVFPLCGILLKKGVTYTVISAFTTSLMMVGFVTFPIEKEYFGIKVTVIRNLLSLLIAVIVAISTGLFFGEVFR